MPGDDEPLAIRGNVNVGIPLVPVLSVVNDDFPAQGTADRGEGRRQDHRRPVCVERAGDDVVADAVLIALPGDDERPRVAHGDTGELLVAGFSDVYLELRSQGRAEGVEPPGIHAIARSQLIVVFLAVTGPGDDEVAVGVHGHVGPLLLVGQVGVHAERVALRGAVGGETAGVDVGIAAAVVGPGDDEIAVGVHGHRAEALHVGEEQGGIRIACEHIEAQALKGSGGVGLPQKDLFAHGAGDFRRGDHGGHEHAIPVVIRGHGAPHFGERATAGNHHGVAEDAAATAATTAAITTEEERHRHVVATGREAVALERIAHHISQTALSFEFP